jgi:anaphase-promoting complex subunit 10
MEIEEMTGWVSLPIPPEPLTSGHLVEVSVLANHQQGRDCHIRQMKVYTPAPKSHFQEQVPFSTVELTEFASLR